jgi:predicted alpha/beta-fold hydrolase
MGNINLNRNYVQGFSLFFFLFSLKPLFAEIPVEKENRSQEQIIEFLNNKIPEEPLSRVAGSSMISTGLVNLYSFTENDADRLGFKEYILATSEGYKSQFYAKIAKEKRPTVVIVGGLGSNIHMEAFHRFGVPLAMEQGWNVILLENATSAEWVSRNASLQISGYEAGWNLYLLLKAIRQNPNLGPFISELNLVGLSLGGSDCNFANYFDSILGENVINGAILTFGSPADRLGSLQALRQKNTFKNLATQRVFHKIYTGSLDVFKKFSSLDFPSLFQHMTLTDTFHQVYLKPAHDYFLKHPHHFAKNKMGFKKIPLSSAEQIYKISGFVHLFNLGDYWQHMTRPHLWVHAIDDPVVEYETTALHIAEQEVNENIGMLPTPKGGHLAQPVVYGDEWVKDLIVSYFSYWGSQSFSHYHQWKSKEVCSIQRSKHWPYTRHRVCEKIPAIW